MIKILNIVGALKYGGVETLLVNYAQKIDRKTFVYDFITVEVPGGVIEEKLLATGSKVYHIPRRRENLFGHILGLWKFLLKHKAEYDIIHAHMSEEGYLPLFLAWIVGYEIRISHSHTSYINSKVDFVMKCKCLLTTLFANNYAGCSENANIFLYGKLKKCVILPNIIDYKKYYFNINEREKFRIEFKMLKDEVALLMLGRLNWEKNHEYIFRMFAENQIKNNTNLYVVGDGGLKNKLDEYIKNNKLEKRIHFLGSRGDINCIINAFDALLLPSIHEGFPMVLIEAQVNGLPCIASNNITILTNISGNISYIPLKTHLWVEKINSTTTRNLNNLKDYKDKISMQYDITKGVIKLEEYYKQLKV